MLSENTVTRLAALTHRADAKRGVCWLPLAGIVWDDEFPSLRELFAVPEEDRKQIFRLFTLRVARWRKESLAEDDLGFWEELRAQVPEWAFFQRQTVTAEDLQAQNDAEKETADGLKALFDDADEVTITEEDGVQSFSATFDLKKDERAKTKASLLKRILDRWR